MKISHLHFLTYMSRIYYSYHLHTALCFQFHVSLQNNAYQSASRPYYKKQWILDLGINIVCKYSFCMFYKYQQVIIAELRIHLKYLFLYQYNKIHHFTFHIVWFDGTMYVISIMALSTLLACRPHVRFELINTNNAIFCIQHKHFFLLSVLNWNC